MCRSAISFIFLMWASTVWGCSSKLYSLQAQLHAVQTGKIVVLHFVSQGCNTCAAQKSVLRKIENEAFCQTIEILTVDIHEHKAVAQRYKIPHQSIFVGLNKNGVETQRLIGVTDRATIRNFLASISAKTTNK